MRALLLGPVVLVHPVQSTITSQAFILPVSQCEVLNGVAAFSPGDPRPCCSMAAGQLCSTVDSLTEQL